MHDGIATRKSFPTPWRANVAGAYRAEGQSDPAGSDDAARFGGTLGPRQPRKAVTFTIEDDRPVSVLAHINPLRRNVSIQKRDGFGLAWLAMFHRENESRGIAL
jgi:hypothetical protein